MLHDDLWQYVLEETEQFLLAFLMGLLELHHLHGRKFLEDDIRILILFLPDDCSEIYSDFLDCVLVCLVPYVCHTLLLVMVHRDGDGFGVSDRESFSAEGSVDDSGSSYIPVS